jgi:hypothetical protein
VQQSLVSIRASTTPPEISSRNGDFADEQNHWTRRSDYRDGRCNRCLVENHGHQAGSGGSSRKGSGGRPTNHLSFRHHDRARQKPSSGRLAPGELMSHEEGAVEDLENSPMRAAHSPRRRRGAWRPRGRRGFGDRGGNREDASPPSIREDQHHPSGRTGQAGRRLFEPTSGLTRTGLVDFGLGLYRSIDAVRWRLMKKSRYLQDPDSAGAGGFF